MGAASAASAMCVADLAVDAIVARSAIVVVRSTIVVIVVVSAHVVVAALTIPWATVVIVAWIGRVARVSCV